MDDRMIVLQRRIDVLILDHEKTMYQQGDTTQGAYII